MNAPLSLGAWLTPERATAWCRVLAAAELVWVIAQIVSAHGAKDLMQTDFTCFWAAASLTLHDSPTAVYHVMKMAAAEHSLQSVADNLFEPFMYPPSYLLLLLPLGFVTPTLALACFTVSGVTLFLLCVRRLLARNGNWLAILAFPGLLVTAGDGQNGLLTAACFGGGALFLDKRPFLAGLCLGALSCKPHLGVFVPVVLLGARRWRALAGAATSAIGLAALSCLVLGIKVWGVFAGAAIGARHVLTGGLSDPSQLQSIWGAGRLLHGPALGAACQLGFSLAALGLLFVLARRRPGGQAEIAALAVATLVGTPYLMDYDLAILAIPLAWLFKEAHRTGWRPWEKYAALATYMMPMLTHGIAKSFGLPLAPLILVSFSALVFGRANGEDSLAHAPQGVFAEG